MGIYNASLLRYNHRMQKLRKKQKLPTKAQQALAAADKAMLDKWASQPKFGRAPVKAVKPLEAPKPYIRDDGVSKVSSVTSMSGSTPLKESPIYTGDKMLGIATMHKSNAVPVFDSKAAIEVSSMRRG